MALLWIISSITAKIRIQLARPSTSYVKKGGIIGFATWPPELSAGSMFRTNAKYNATVVPNPSHSPIEWGIPDVIRKRLTGVNEIYFERGTVNVPILSPNHYWNHFSTDFLNAIRPYIYDNELR